MKDLAFLPEELQSRLGAELQVGEMLHWSGQPSPARYMRDGFKLWFFFIPWTAFSLFWIVAASGFSFPSFDGFTGLFPLFGLPFLLIGIFGLSAPLLMRRKAGSIVYALTDRRALIIEGNRSVTVKSYPVKEIDEIERTEHRDGSGDLVFRKESYRDSDGDAQTRKLGFVAVPNVRRVGQLLESLRGAKGA